MGFIQIETMITGQHTKMELYTDGIYEVNFENFKIESLDKIWGLFVLQDMIIIKKSDRAFRQGIVIADLTNVDRRQNNLEAYDKKGNFLWNIGDIIGDIRCPIANCCLITAEKALLNQYILNYSYDSNAALLYLSDYARIFIVDPVNRELLATIYGKMK